MSSDILSHPIDISKYALIYGGAQKNTGPAGVTFIIIKEDILGKVERVIPSMLDYKTHIASGSMFNTPPCLPIFAVKETLKWVKEMGGVVKMREINHEKANLLYETIDNSRMFVGTAEKNSRSVMNVCFVMKEQYKDKEADFISFAQSKGMVGLKGHRSVGGFRASIYNALPKESVLALIDVIKEYEKLNDNIQLMYLIKFKQKEIL